MIKVGDAPKEIRGAAIALKMIRRDVRNQINRETTKTFGPVWKNEIGSRASSARDARVFKGARVAGGNPPTLYAATSKRPMRGGLVPAEDSAGFEFGTPNRSRYSEVRSSSRKGKRYSYKRRASRQMPPRFPKGRVVYPALGAVGPRIASLWSQLVIHRIFDAAEEGK